jgi:hypothetical protein
MTSLNGNFVKCAHIRCDEYVPRKSPKETPFCSFHGTYDTTSPVTPEEMFEMYDTTQQAFYERCKILDELVAELAAKLNDDKKNKHGKMIRWNQNFEMCSNCDDVTTCTYFKILNRIKCD